MRNFPQRHGILRHSATAGVLDPLAGSPWSAPGTVAGFSRSAPNSDLLSYAAQQQTTGALRVLDIGCGAGRNAVPLAHSGCDVVGIDLSWPMLRAAADRRAEGLRLICAPMHELPVGDREFDLIIAHGIWNLARSGAEFRSALTEAARVARPGAGLFLFTFSRHTLPAGSRPDAGESFVFSSWNGEPQCFLTEAEIIHELLRVGFVRDTDVPLTEYNVTPLMLRIGGPPAIYEGTFTLRPARAMSRDRR